MAQRYTAAARALHWLTALAVLLLVVLGVWITAFEPKDEALKYRLYDLHESLGFSLLVLSLARLAWRIRHPAPPLPADFPVVLRRAAQANHAALYALLLAMPVMGFLAVNAWGFPFSWWGLLPIPSPIGKDEALAGLLSAIHFWCAMALAALAGLHIAAALWHGLVRRDGVLQRMV